MHQAEAHKDELCLVLQHAGKDDRSFTYAEFMEVAGSYAQAYAKAGLKPGDVIIVIIPHGIELIAAFWGAILQGVVPAIMPFLTEKMHPERYKSDLLALLQITQPQAIISNQETWADIAGIASAAGLQPEHILKAEDIEIRSTCAGDEWLGEKANPEDIVFLQHSSGTTGLQKGVAISHQALLNQLESYAKAIKLTPQDKVVSWLPLYHDMGLIAGFLLPILAGIPLILMSPFDWVKSPVRLMKAVSQYGGTLSWLPNFAFNFCASKIRDHQMEGVDLSTWRAITNCSEPIYARSFAMFAEKFAPFGLNPDSLAASYAMAENVFGVTQGGIERENTIMTFDLEALQAEKTASPAAAGQPAVTMVSSGFPIEGTRVKAVDEKGKDVGTGQVGELAVQSNCMLSGYYKRPDETEKVMHDGWYLTGDYGFLYNNEVFVSGRKKDMIIVGGKNVFPQDIEAVVNGVAGIQPGRAVAFGILNEELGTEDVAVIAEFAATDVTEMTSAKIQELQDLVRITVNQNTAISLKYIHLVQPKWLIKTSSGKIARAANRDKFLKELASH